MNEPPPATLALVLHYADADETYRLHLPRFSYLGAVREAVRLVERVKAVKEAGERMRAARRSVA